MIRQRRSRNSQSFIVLASLEECGPPSTRQQEVSWGNNRGAQQRARLPSSSHTCGTFLHSSSNPCNTFSSMRYSAPDSHPDKENLRRAKAMVEDVLRSINEEQRRREIVKEILAAGKLAEFLKKGLGIVGRLRGVTTPRSISQADSDEAERFTQTERDIHRSDEFIQQFARETVEWVQSVQALISALRVWAEGFGCV
jgi:hypothetical protein